jgi:hypothetical protein
MLDLIIDEEERFPWIPSAALSEELGSNGESATL